MEQEDYNKAIFCFIHQQYEKAAILFRKILEQNPNRPDAWDYLGKIYCYKKDIENSTKCHYRAINLDFYNPFVWYNAGTSCTHLELWGEALNCFSKAIELEPVVFPEFYFDKGCLLYRLNQIEESLCCFNKCIELKPNESSYWIAKGQLLKNIGRCPEAIYCFNQVVKLVPEDYDCWKEMGGLYLSVSDFDNAIRCYEESIKGSPSFLAWNNIGISFHSVNRFKKAVECFDEALLIKPDGYEALTNKGYSLYLLKKLEEAELCYQKSFEINSESFYTYLNYGLLLADIQQYNKALEFFDVAIDINPNDFRGWNGKGNVSFILGEYESALEYYGNALDLEPNDPNLWVNKCTSLLRLSRYKEALKLAEESVILHASFFGCWSCLGIVYEYLKDYNMAIYNLEKAIELNPEDAESWNHRGICLRQIDNLNQALSSYRHASQLQPLSIRYLQNMIVTLCCIGHYNEVIETCDRVIEMFTNKTMQFNKEDYNNIGFVETDEKYYKLIYSNIQNNKGYALLHLERYDEALDCFNGILNLDRDNSLVLGNLGGVYYCLEKYEEANKYCDRAIALEPDNRKFLNLKGMILAKLNKEIEAISYFQKAGSDLVEIVDRFDCNKDFSLFYDLLDTDPFFSDALGKSVPKSEVNKYKKMYLHSLKIIGLLYISKKEEAQVAHYTRKFVSELFLFDNGIFRLNTIDTANDPSEGKALLQYLQSNKESDCTFSEIYKAFIGCFTFNHNCLNQFRLYGKDEGKEATGISIVIRGDFFSVYLNRNIPFMHQNEITKSSQQEKLPLYRCIYIDPKTEYIVSVGQKEENAIYADFLKENSGNSELAMKATMEYKKYINGILQKTRVELKQLKKEADGLDLEIVRKLLISLSLLCKNAAYKEEQECRIFRIEPLSNDEIQIDNEQVYIDYRNINNYVSMVYFGTNALGIEEFKSRLMEKDLEIGCYMSDHPFV